MVLCLAVVGIGYAAGWTQNLYINGTVSTGDVLVEWTTADDAGLDDGIASGTAIITAAGIEGDDTVTITVTDAHPDYVGSAELMMTNLGSIPVSLTTSGSGTGFSITPDPAGKIASVGTYVYTVTIDLTALTVPEDTVDAYSVSYTILASQ